MLKRPKLSRKEIKILEYKLKTHPSARPGLRKPKKWVQNAPEHESVIGIQECHSALLECWSALSKCQMAPLRALAQCSSGDDKTHHFRLFHIRMCLVSHSNCRCLFFKHSSLYKIKTGSQNSRHFYALGETLFHTLKFLIFLISLFDILS